MELSAARSNAALALLVGRVRELEMSQRLTMARLATLPADVVDLTVEIREEPEDTGGKGWCTRQVHCKYIARKWIKYPPKTHPVHCKHVQNFPSQFHYSVPSTGYAQYIHSVPGHVIAVFPSGNPWGNCEFSQRKYPQYSQVAY